MLDFSAYFDTYIEPTTVLSGIIEKYIIISTDSVYNNSLSRIKNPVPEDIFDIVEEQPKVEKEPISDDYGYVLVDLFRTKWSVKLSWTGTNLTPSFAWDCPMSLASTTSSKAHKGCGALSSGSTTASNIPSKSLKRTKLTNSVLLTATTWAKWWQISSTSPFLPTPSTIWPATKLPLFLNSTRWLYAIPNSGIMSEDEGNKICWE